MRYAVIENGKVVNCIEVTTEDRRKIKGLKLVRSDAAGIGDDFDGKEFTRPAAEIDLYAELASIRYARETGGIRYFNAKVDTSRESQAMITGAFAYGQRFDKKSINFKTGSGFTTLDNNQITALAEAVGNHVQRCFRIESECAAKIAAGKITTIEEIEEAFDG